jgi:hypothetical protein
MKTTRPSSLSTASPTRAKAASLWLCAVLALSTSTTTSQAQVGTPVFTNVWNIPTGTGHVLVVSRSTVPPTIKVLDAATGADLGSLNNNNIAGGTFALSCIGVADDGVIYGTGLSGSGTTQAASYRIYRWSSETTNTNDTGSVAPVNVWVGAPGAGFGRYGDSMAVRGSGTNTILIASGSANTNLAIFTYASGDTNGNLSAAEFALASAGLSGGEAGKAISIGTNNTFFCRSSSGTSMHKVSYNTNNLTLSLLANVPVESHTAPISVDNTHNLLLTVGVANDTVAANHQFRISDISNLAAPVILASTNAPTPITADSNLAGQADNNGTYFVGIEAANGLVAYKLTGFVTNLPPVITSQPQTTTNLQGAFATFKVSVSGTAPLKYQWYYNNSTNNLALATNATLTITNLDLTNAGTFKVVITNSFGSVTSALASLTVRTAALSTVMTPLWNIAPGTPGYTFIATDDKQRGLAYNPATDHLLVPSRSPTDPSIFVLDAGTGANVGSMNLSGVSGGTFNLNLAAVADDGAVFACNLTTSASTPSFSLYRWNDDGVNTLATQIFSGDPGQGSNLRWGDTLAVRGAGVDTQILLAQETTAAVALFTTTDGINFNPTLLTENVAQTFALGLAFGRGNTFWVKDFGGALRHYSFDSSLGTATLLQTFTNLPISSAPMAVDATNELLAIISNRENPDNLRLYDLENLQTQSLPWLDTEFVPVNNFNTFGVGGVAFGNGRVYALDTDCGLIAETLTLTQAVPVITSQPANITNNLGATVTFGVTSTGYPRAFQWRFNGTDIAGETSGSLALVNLTDANIGAYDLIISNSFGSVTSSVASLFILPVITSQPSSLTVTTNDPASFNVSADGQSPLFYQWKRNGVNLIDGNGISGSTSATLSIANAQISDAGDYTVVVTNVAGTVTSQMAVLTVTYSVTNGDGTGLNGDYYSNQLQTFTNAPTLTRLDPVVDFDWSLDSPDPLISTDHFSIRWSGQVLPQYSQIYTFYTKSDDGARLWVDGQLIIDRWISQPATEVKGTITLNAGQKYDLLMEYFENGVSASAQLSWSSPSKAKEIIPSTQLFPATVPLSTHLSFSPSGNNQVFNWVGSYHLQSATNVTGPYVDVTGVTVAPYTNNVNSAPQKFYRLRNQ